MNTTPNGCLLIDKPRGWTSHDVVARVRRLMGERRVGHAGTLDPMATGLLVVAVGPATRLLRYSQAQTKVYTGRIQLGIATDSLDADGAVVGNSPVPDLSESTALAAATGLSGDIMQTPPMVSAIQQGGRRLYDLAREGIEVERKSRPVHVADFSVAPTDDLAVWSFRIECSVGTYIRVLASDWAEQIGTVGHLCELRRESSGAHLAATGWTLESLEAALGDGVEVLRTPLSMVAHLPRVVVDDTIAQRIRHGQRLALPELAAADEGVVVDAVGDLVATVKRRDDSYQPDVVMPASDETVV